MSIVADAPPVTLDRATLEPLAREALARYLEADVQYEQARSLCWQAETARSNARRALLGLLASLDVVLDPSRDDAPFERHELAAIHDLTDDEAQGFRVIRQLAETAFRNTR